MSKRKRGVWLGYLIAGLYFVWLISSMSPMGRLVAEGLSRRVPGWLALLSWALCPLLAAILMGPLDVQVYVWVPLYAVLLISLVFFAVSFHYHPIISVSILVLGYFEVYWLLPKWQAKWNRDHEPR
jgi:hypothetical protein